MLNVLAIAEAVNYFSFGFINISDVLRHSACCFSLCWLKLGDFISCSLGLYGDNMQLKILIDFSITKLTIGIRRY